MLYGYAGILWYTVVNLMHFCLIAINPIQTLCKSEHKFSERCLAIIEGLHLVENGCLFAPLTCDSSLEVIKGAPRNTRPFVQHSSAIS